MVLIQQKVHRIFLTRKTKNDRPRSFCCIGRSFCFVELQASLLNTAEQEA